MRQPFQHPHNILIFIIKVHIFSHFQSFVPFLYKNHTITLFLEHFLRICTSYNNPNKFATKLWQIQIHSYFSTIFLSLRNIALSLRAQNYVAVLFLQFPYRVNSIEINPMALKTANETVFLHRYPLPSN